MKEIQVNKEFQNRYKVVEKIGEGGTSIIYHLYDPKLSRDVCLKQGIVKANYDMEHLRKIFANEVSILQILKGKHSPLLFDFDLADLEIYMEYCKGHSLQEECEQWKKKNRYPSQIDMLKLFIKLSQAIDFFHSQKVIIADIKPNNIILEIVSTSKATPSSQTNTKDYNIILLDFGSAYIKDKKTEIRSNTYSIGYTAYEILKGELPTFASDIYSLGVIFFILLTHREITYDLAIDFNNFPTQNDPMLRNLIQEMTSSESSKRPSLAYILTKLEEIHDTYQQSFLEKIHCPYCSASITIASFCPSCGKNLTRGATILSGTIEKGIARIKLKDAFDKKLWLDVLSYAQQANSEKSLDWEGVAMAIIALARISNKEILKADIELWIKCGDGIDIKDLADDIYQDFLESWGEILSFKQIPLTKYKNWFLEGTKRFAQNDVLWSWLALALPFPEQQTILQQALASHPNSICLRKLLGECMGKSKRFPEALKLWLEAVDKGAKELSFLMKVYKLATYLGNHQYDKILQRQILATPCNTPEESLELAQFARKEGETLQALSIIEQGLTEYPLHSPLKKCKIQILFDQHKYELVLSETQKISQDSDLSLLRGASYYYLKQYLEASQELASSIEKNHTIEIAWEYLVRSYLQMNQHELANQVCKKGLNIFPNNTTLREIKKTFL